MKLHPMQQANKADAESAHFYALIGKRIELAEEVVRAARACCRSHAPLHESIRSAVARLEAIESSLRSLSPNITFDKHGEPCLTPTTPK
jgi:hypothetical protein